MDVSLPSLAPRVVADVRPSADVAATARIDRPLPAVVPVPVVAPASLAQEGLVVRIVLEKVAVEAADGPSPGFGERPQRVLKPWGVLMLPSEELPQEDIPADAEPVARAEPASASAGEPNPAVAPVVAPPAEDLPEAAPGPLADTPTDESPSTSGS